MGPRAQKIASVLQPARLSTTQMPPDPLGIGKKLGKRRRSAGAILAGETTKPQSAEADHSRRTTGAHADKTRIEGKSSEPAPLKCRFHDLRHSAVTRLLEGGIPYPVVASMMGWSAATAIRMAKRYGHIGSNALRDAADVLGGLGIPAGSLKKSPKSTEAENVAVQ